jgi:hypothetical protein
MNDHDTIRHAASLSLLLRPPQHDPARWDTQHHGAAHELFLRIAPQPAAPAIPAKKKAKPRKGRRRR